MSQEDFVRDHGDPQVDLSKADVGDVFGELAACRYVSSVPVFIEADVARQLRLMVPAQRTLPRSTMRLTEALATIRLATGRAFDVVFTRHAILLVWPTR